MDQNVNTPGQFDPPLLIDNFSRPITYLRVSVTDRCNLRCTYCMPAVGIQLLQKKEILSWEELLRLITIFAQLGIKKLRITGGEPFVRQGILDFLRQARQIRGIESLFVTTNGIEISQYIPELKKVGITGINLSLDTLDRQRFADITRRDSLDKVLAAFNLILKHEIPLKINMVVKSGLNVEDIIALSHLAENHPIDVRFIEEMPFNGEGQNQNFFDAEKIEQLLRICYPSMQLLPQDGSTAKMLEIPGFAGRLGIIAGYSRHFCSTCNRIRIKANGKLKTCLYDGSVLDFKQLIRSGATDDDIRKKILKAISRKPKDGFEAFAASKDSLESMASIGG